MANNITNLIAAVTSEVDPTTTMMNKANLATSKTDLAETWSSKVDLVTPTMSEVKRSTTDTEQTIVGVRSNEGEQTNSAEQRLESKTKIQR